MTPGPRGYPRSSPVINNIVGAKLTDETIHQYALRGYYGDEAQKRARFNDIVNKPIKQTKPAKTEVEKQKSVISDLLNRHKQPPCT